MSVNIKRVRRLMRLMGRLMGLMGLMPIYRQPRPSIPANLEDAKDTLAWGANPDTMWNHRQTVCQERSRRRNEKLYDVIRKRAAIERDKGSPIRFVDEPRYRTPVYRSASGAKSPTRCHGFPPTPAPAFRRQSI